MRVTNLMTHNKSLNNMQRNMRHLQRLYEQTTSQKEISRPSQDPLIASRSLRFRTQLAGIEQRQQNVESGHAWMNMTESAFFNILRGDAQGSLFGNIKDNLLRAANDTATLDDKLVMLTNIENLKNQIGLEMNQSIGGRFLFAGWRTDQPPFLLRPQPGVEHVITQTFNVRDIEQTYSFQRFPVGDPNHPGQDLTGTPIHNPINILKLPFREANGTQLMIGNREVDPTDLPDTWPDSWGGYWLGDTANSPAGMVPGGATSVFYPYPNNVVQGGLGPPVPPLGIFAPGDTPPASSFNLVRISSSDPDAFAPPDDGQTIHYIPETGELVFGNQVRASFQDGTTITYHVSNLQQNDLNPFVYFDTHSTTPRTVQPVNNHWPQVPQQSIHYEFHAGATIQVNSLAKDIFTARLFADLRRLIDFANELTPPNRRELENMFSAPYPEGFGLTGEELNTRVNKQMADENAIIRSVLFDRINNMIRFMDEHTIDATREHTSLGVRMRQVEMFEIRLEQDEGNFTELLSYNEDVDMHEKLLMQSATELSFQAALRVIATNIQLSLVNFI